MGAQTSHLSQADKNEKFYLAICSSNALSEQFTDWAVVVLFYSALHYVDAFLDTEEIHPRTHTERNRLVSRKHQISDIYPNYLSLHDRSIDARYNLVCFPLSAVERLWQEHYQTVKRHILDFLDVPPE